MTDKNERARFITYFGRDKLAETAPEQFIEVLLKELQSSIPFIYQKTTQANPLIIKAGEFDLRPDFILEGGDFPKKVIEVDGVYHFTEWQEKKRRWRDSLILAQGYDVIHIDARLCLNRWREHLKRKLTNALVHGDPVTVIPA